MAEVPARCPRCSSTRLYRNGLRYLADGSSIQRYLCRECGYRFSENTKNKLNHKVEAGAHRNYRRVLVEVEREIEKRAAGATLGANVKSEIINFAWWLKKQGYAESTINSRVKKLKTLLKLGTDLNDPESVKETIAKQKHWSPGYKEIMVEAYSSFLTMLGRSWNPPRYKRVPKLPFIPLEKEIDQFIAGCSSTKRLMVFLQLLKETGIRCGEALRLKWTDVDLVANVIRVSPEKGSNPRALKISNKLSAMLNMLPKTSDRVFPTTYDAIRKSFDRQRKRLARKLQNPRLLQITFHTHSAIGKQPWNTPKPRTSFM